MHKIRTFGERYDPGGGGINVARVVHELGGDTLALFAAGGVTGQFVEEMLSQAGVLTNRIPIRGPTRISLTVREQASGSEYRFVPEGPRVDAAECARILARPGRHRSRLARGERQPSAGRAAGILCECGADSRSSRHQVRAGYFGPCAESVAGSCVSTFWQTQPQRVRIRSVGRASSEPSHLPRQAVELVRSGVSRT